MYLRILAVLLCVALSGCANSADHEVVVVSKAFDDDLNCSEIRAEKRRVQTIIDRVQQDKNDMTGSDVVDGLLWFPFNVIAKQSNYANAVKAAEQRIDVLRSMEKEKKCKK